MPKTQTFSAQLVRLIFFGEAIPGIAQNATTSPLTTYYVSLHTDDPGWTGTQTTHEVAYAGYARVPVARSSSGWSITETAVVTPRDHVTFPMSVDTAPTVVTHAAIGTAATGPGAILYRAVLNRAMTVSPGVQPILTNASFVEER